MTEKNYDSQAILEFLKQHPDFLLEHADALYTLQLPRRSQGGVISFVEHQVQRLQQENKKLNEQLYTLISNAQRSELIRQQVHRWACHLLTRPHWARDTQAMAQALAENFELPYAALLMAHDAPTPTRYCGPIAQAPQQFDLPSHLLSMACIPLQLPPPASPMGTLIVASADPNHFTTDMATDFLTQIAELCALALSTVQ